MKTKFTFLVDAKADIETLDFFLDPGGYFYTDTAPNIFYDHFELEKRLKKVTGGKRREVIGNYVAKYMVEKNGEINNFRMEVEKSWGKIQTKIERRLAEIIETDWEGIGPITVRIGIATVYPRDLDKKEMSICYLDPIDYSHSVILHEITHFLWFKKWRWLFSDDKPEYFEAPHPFWHLSEIMAQIINHDPKLSSLVPRAAKYKDAQYDKPISMGAEKSIAKYFEEEFLKGQKRGESIDDFLESSREKVLEVFQEALVYY